MFGMFISRSTMSHVMLTPESGDAYMSTGRPEASDSADNNQRSLFLHNGRKMAEQRNGVQPDFAGVAGQLPRGLRSIAQRVRST